MGAVKEDGWGVKRRPISWQATFLFPCAEPPSHPPSTQKQKALCQDHTHYPATMPVGPNKNTHVKWSAAHKHAVLVFLKTKRADGYGETLSSCVGQRFDSIIKAGLREDMCSCMDPE